VETNVNLSNLVEYDDPVLYDQENSKFEPDGPFYLDLARRLGGQVLELGCGTGRVTLSLARQGIAMTGVDVLPRMLERARKKPSSNLIRWIQADARLFRIEQRYRLILESGGTFQHMLERSDQEAMLARVREHLEPEGFFVVSAIFPKPEFLASDPLERPWFDYVDESGRAVQVSGTQHYDPLRQIKTETAIRRWIDADGRDVVRRAPLMLRYIFPCEMEALLTYNNFAIIEQYGGWDKRPLTDSSDLMIFVCRVVPGVRRMSAS
jgi:SAM-dependent methyltransferase